MIGFVICCVSLLRFVLILSIDVLLIFENSCVLGSGWCMCVVVSVVWNVGMVVVSWCVCDVICM